ncbi:hypothetical protein B566_EDAN007078 [Ephemera danica]|nr:hypothetical protein B566_EDAN007078 [Ephemera danica]
MENSLHHPTRNLPVIASVVEKRRWDYVIAEFATAMALGDIHRGVCDGTDRKQGGEGRQFPCSTPRWYREHCGRLTVVRDARSRTQELQKLQKHTNMATNRAAKSGFAAEAQRKFCGTATLSISSLGIHRGTGMGVERLFNNRQAEMRSYGRGSLGHWDVIDLRAQLQPSYKYRPKHCE